MAEGIGALLVRIGADTSEFVSALNTADKAVGKFSASVDKRLIDPLVKVVGVASAAAGGLFLFAKSAADTVDQLGKLSQKVGVSVESLSGLKYAAELSDVKIDALGQGLKQLSKFMVENNVTGVSVEEQLLRISDQFEQSADGAGKTAAAMKYFGKSGADLIPFLNQGRAGIEELRKEAARLGVIFSTEAAKKAEEFNDNLTRLKASAQGLQVELGGPLVKALNEVAKSFLDARRNGESFFGALLEGYRTLVTGTDRDKFNAEMKAAEARLAAAQANVARLQQTGGSAAAMGLKKARTEMAAAEADLERLKAIKPFMAPDESPKKEEETGKKKNELTFVDPKEVEKREQEVRDIMHKVREENDKLELEQIAKQNEEKLKAQELFTLQQLEAEEAAAEERDRIQREEALGRIQLEEETERRLYGIITKHRSLDLASAKSFFGSIAGLMQTKSKKLFEIGKAGAIAETIVNTHAAAMAAYKAMAGIPVVGPALGAAAAGAAVLAGIAQVNAIRSQSYGGGGSVGTFAASPSTGLPTGTPGGDVGGSAGTGGGGSTVILKLTGDTVGRGQLEDLFERANKYIERGGRLVLA